MDLDYGDKVWVGRAGVRATNPVPVQTKPKIPIGRRGESLIIVADYPREG